MDSSASIKRSVATVATGLLLGIVLGIVTNTVNGAVSPIYFQKVMGFADPGPMAIGQGILEGSILGSALGVVVAVVVAIKSKDQAKTPDALRLLFGIAASLVLWFVGGGIGCLVSAVKPNAFLTQYGGAFSWREAVAFSWVGGSIVGLQVGSIAATALACAHFRAKIPHHAPES